MFASKKDTLIYVKAILYLKATKEGGRKTPLLRNATYRPNHAFEKPSSPEDLHGFIGEVRLSESQSLSPGENAFIEVAFLKGGNIENYLTVGRKWFIYEGQQLVGEAEIVGV